MRIAVTTLVWIVCAGIATAQGSGSRRTLQLAQPSHPAPPGAPHVVAHVPDTLPSDGDVEMVVFVHGWRGCAAVLYGRGELPCRPGAAAHAGWELGRRFAQSGRRSLFAIPQLAYRTRSGHPGRFARAGYFDQWVGAVAREVLAPGVRVGRVTLVAHSAGYETAAAVLADPVRTTPVRNVVLLDALYAQEQVFARWLASAPEHRLLSLYRAGGSTARAHRRLRRTLRRQGLGWHRHDEGSLADALRAERAVLWRVNTPHGRFPHAHLAQVLRALP